MGNVNYRVEPHSITIRPYLGTGWETVLNQMDREVAMQLKLLGLRLPVRRRFSYSQVARVATVCRETWWSRIWLEWSIGNPEERSPMPDKGWRYDILLAVEGGKKPIRIGTVKSPDIASEIERESRQRLGLSET
jgi:hypothetical protein